eukprot:8378493-Pyramimonas_sp.AAC.1
MVKIRHGRSWAEPFEQNCRMRPECGNSICRYTHIQIYRRWRGKADRKHDGLIILVVKRICACMHACVCARVRATQDCN